MSITEERPTTVDQVIHVPLQEIGLSPFQPRTTFEEAAIETLAASIKENGLQQPITLRRTPGWTYEWQLLAGERRLRAHELLGLPTIPALDRGEMNDKLASDLCVMENLQRRELNAVETARAYRALVDNGWKQKEVAAKYSVSEGNMSKMLKILELPEDVLAMLAAGSLTTAHGFALLSYRDHPEICTFIARYVVENSTSTKELEKGIPFYPNSLERAFPQKVHIFNWQDPVDPKKHCKNCPFDALRKTSNDYHVCLNKPHHAELVQIATKEKVEAEKAAAEKEKAAVQRAASGARAAVEEYVAVATYHVEPEQAEVLVQRLKEQEKAPDPRVTELQQQIAALEESARGEAGRRYQESGGKVGTKQTATEKARLLEFQRQELELRAGQIETLRGKIGRLLVDHSPAPVATPAEEVPPLPEGLKLPHGITAKRYWELPIIGQGVNWSKIAVLNNPVPEGCEGVHCSCFGLARRENGTLVQYCMDKPKHEALVSKQAAKAKKERKLKRQDQAAEALLKYRTERVRGVRIIASYMFASLGRTHFAPALKALGLAERVDMKLMEEYGFENKLKALEDLNTEELLDGVMAAMLSKELSDFEQSSGELPKVGYLLADGHSNLVIRRSGDGAGEETPDEAPAPAAAICTRCNGQFTELDGALLLWEGHYCPACTAQGVEVCRVCGCTEEIACPDGCAWVENNGLLSLCSGCQQVPTPAPAHYAVGVLVHGLWDGMDILVNGRVTATEGQRSTISAGELGTFYVIGELEWLVYLEDRPAPLPEDQEFRQVIRLHPSWFDDSDCYSAVASAMVLNKVSITEQFGEVPVDFPVLALGDGLYVVTARAFPGDGNPQYATAYRLVDELDYAGGPDRGDYYEGVTLMVGERRTRLTGETLLLSDPQGALSGADAQVVVVSDPDSVEELADAVPIETDPDDADRVWVEVEEARLDEPKDLPSLYCGDKVVSGKPVKALTVNGTLYVLTMGVMRDDALGCLRMDGYEIIPSGEWTGKCFSYAEKVRENRDADTLLSYIGIKVQVKGATYVIKRAASFVPFGFAPGADGKVEPSVATASQPYRDQLTGVPTVGNSVKWTQDGQEHTGYVQGAHLGGEISVVPDWGTVKNALMMRRTDEGLEVIPDEDRPLDGNALPRDVFAGHDAGDLVEVSVKGEECRGVIVSRFLDHLKVSTENPSRLVDVMDPSSVLRNLTRAQAAPVAG